MMQKTRARRRNSRAATSPGGTAVDSAACVHTAAAASIEHPPETSGRLEQAPRQRRLGEATGRAPAPGPPGLREYRGLPRRRRHASRRRLRTFERDVEKPSAPQLEGQNCPEMQIEIAAALVQPKQPLDITNIENASLTAGIRQKDIPRKPKQLSAEPACERNGKALLLAIDNFIG